MLRYELLCLFLCPGHMHPPFFKIMNEIQEGLQYVFQTSSKYTLLISGTGHAGTLLAALLWEWICAALHFLVQYFSPKRMTDQAWRLQSRILWSLVTPLSWVIMVSGARGCVTWQRDMEVCPQSCRHFCEHMHVQWKIYSSVHIVNAVPVLLQQMWLTWRKRQAKPSASRSSPRQ